MKPLTEEWVKKAERDFSTMIRESRVERDQNADAITFHAEQCAEKYLKGYLQEHDVAFPRLHDLGKILDLAVTIQPLLEAIREDCIFLTDFAVKSRYPGDEVTINDANHAVRSCTKIRSAFRELLRDASQLQL
jgi:HEPN domain-containing protein